MFIKAVLSFALASAVLLSTPALVFSSIEEIEAVSGEIEQDSNLASGGWPTDAESIASYEQVLEAAATRAKVAEHEQKTLLATELNLDVGFIRQEGMNLTTGVKSTLVYPLGYCNKVPFEYRYFNLYGIFYFTWSWKNSTNKPYVKGFPTSKCSGNPILELQAPSLPYLGAPNATYQTTLKENKPQYGSFLWTYSLPLCGGPATGYQMWSIPEGTFTLKCTPFNGSADPRVQQVYQLVNDPNAIAFFKYAGEFPLFSLDYIFNNSRCFKSGIPPIGAVRSRFTVGPECILTETPKYYAWAAGGASGFNARPSQKGPSNLLV